MPWVRLDDSILDHPKLINAGPMAERLYIRSIVWSSRHLTDGAVPKKAVDHICRWDGVTAPSNVELAGHLVEAGLWHPTEEGWAIHDFADYQPSREQVLAKRTKAREAVETKREKTRERTRRWRERKRSERDAVDVTLSESVTERHGDVTERHTVSPLAAESVTDAPVTLLEATEKPSEINGVTHVTLPIAESVTRDAKRTGDASHPLPPIPSHRSTTERERDSTVTQSECVTGPLSAADLEKEGFRRFGSLGGINIVRARELAPVARWEWDAALKTEGKSWAYALKVLRSMREEQANPKPRAASPSAPRRPRRAQGGNLRQATDKLMEWAVAHG